MEIEVTEAQLREILSKHCKTLTYEQLDQLLEELRQLTIQNTPKPTPKKSLLDRIIHRGVVEFP